MRTIPSLELLLVSGLRTPSPGLGGVKKLYWTGRNPVLSFPTASPRSRLRSKQSDPMAGFVVAILPQLPERQNMKNVYIRGIPNSQWDTHDSLWLCLTLCTPDCSVRSHRGGIPVAYLKMRGYFNQPHRDSRFLTSTRSPSQPPYLHSLLQIPPPVP